MIPKGSFVLSLNGDSAHSVDDWTSNFSEANAKKMKGMKWYEMHNQQQVDEYLATHAIKSCEYTASHDVFKAVHDDVRRIHPHGR